MQIRSSFNSCGSDNYQRCNSDVPVKSCVTWREYKLLFKWGMIGGLKGETNCSICAN